MCCYPGAEDSLEEDFISYGILRRNDNYFLIGRYFEGNDVISFLKEKVIHLIEDNDLWVEVAEHQVNVPAEGEICWNDIPYTVNALANDIQFFFKKVDWSQSHKCYNQIIVIKSPESTEKFGSITITNLYYLKYPRLIQIIYDFTKEQPHIVITTSSGCTYNNNTYSIKWNSDKKTTLDPNLSIIYGKIFPQIVEWDKTKFPLSENKPIEL